MVGRYLKLNTDLHFPWRFILDHTRQCSAPPHRRANPNANKYIIFLSVPDGMSVCPCVCVCNLLFVLTHSQCERAQELCDFNSLICYVIYLLFNFFIRSLFGYWCKPFRHTAYKIINNIGQAYIPWMSERERNEIYCKRTTGQWRFRT